MNHPSTHPSTLPRTSLLPLSSRSFTSLTLPSLPKSPSHCHPRFLCSDRPSYTGPLSPSTQVTFDSTQKSLGLSHPPPSACDREWERDCDVQVGALSGAATPVVHGDMGVEWSGRQVHSAVVTFEAPQKSPVVHGNMGVDLCRLLPPSVPSVALSLSPSVALSLSPSVAPFRPFSPSLALSRPLSPSLALSRPLSPSVTLCRPLSPTYMVHPSRLVSNNNLSGAIPPSISGLSRLLALYVSPSLLALYVSPSLLALYVSPSLRVLPSLHVPTSLLVHIRLLVTRLGTLRRGDITRMLDGNALESPIPSSLSGLTALKSMDVSKNKFSEDFPTVLTRMTRVKHMKLGRNDFTGSIPASITSLVSLTYLDLGYTLLSGTIPTAITKMQHLSRLDLQIPTLTGSVPASMGAMLNLQYLYVNYEATPCGYGECEVVQYSGTAFCRACTDFCDTCSRRGEEEGEEMS
ncbi:unnamed protein product [Closterium sp. NIES-65]|nr:unnamed protein product [Closterium sp. NIES-65]